MAAIRKRAKGVWEGWVVQDRWKPLRDGTPKPKTGLRWTAGAWDPNRIVNGAKKPGYKFKSFPDGDQGYADARDWAVKTAEEFKSLKATATTFMLSDIGEKYCEHLELTKGDNPRHVAQVRQCVRLGVEAGLGDILSERFAYDVERWLRAMKTSREFPAAASTRNKFLGFIKSISTYAKKRHGAPVNRMDTVESFKQKKAMKEVYSLDELRLLLADKMRDDELYVYIATMIYLGFRPSECAALTINDFDFTNMTVRLRSEVEGNKFQREALVPLQVELHDILQSLDAKAILPLKYAEKDRADCLLRAVNKYIVKAGVIPKKMVRHAFRNSFASLHAAIGTNFAQVLSYLNHADVSVSKDYQSAGMVYINAVKTWPRDGQFFIVRSQ